MTISLRDVGRAVDAGTSGAPPRTVFAALPETSILALNQRRLVLLGLRLRDKT
jgi:hypothetical protein